MINSESEVWAHLATIGCNRQEISWVHLAAIRCNGLIKVDDNSQTSDASGKVWSRLISTKKSGFTPSLDKLLSFLWYVSVTWLLCHRNVTAVLSTLPTHHKYVMISLTRMHSLLACKKYAKSMQKVLSN